MSDAHRPWPIPSRPWAGRMLWHDLLFMHWPIASELLIPLLPRGLELDTFDGQAWLGIVPFHMSGMHLRGLLPLPMLSAMPEINVRTYVTAEDKPGVLFLSLDAGSWFAAFLARLTYHLPYFYAAMRVEHQDDWIHYKSRRIYREARAEFVATYRPTASVQTSRPGQLDYWLTERYCLYTQDGQGRLCRGDVHHAPWPLQPAEAEIHMNHMLEAWPMKLPDTAPLLHFARHLEVVAWQLEPLRYSQAAGGTRKRGR